MDMYTSIFRECEFENTDRFIPPRNKIGLAQYTTVADNCNALYFTELEERDYKFDNYANSDFQRLKYRQILWDVLFGPSSSSEQEQKKIERVDWPVTARKERIKNGPMIYLDMPGMHYNTHFQSLLDWGSENHFATIFEGKLFICCVRDNVVEPFISNLKFSHSLKWSRCGTKLAIQATNVKKMKSTYIYQCCENCYHLEFAWKKNGTLLISCLDGIVSKLKNGVFFKHRTRLETFMADKIQLSCNDKYMACRNVLGKIFVVNCKSFEKISEINIGVQCFSWHPTCEYLLALGTKKGCLQIWNINTNKCVSKCWFPGKIDALSFNPISAELVASVFHIKIKTNVIVILKNTACISDAIKWHEGRVQYLLWNKSGTNLATVGTDEDLAIWEFFGRETDAIRKKLKRKPKIPDLFIGNIIR